jgi:hypothetical protein
MLLFIFVLFYIPFCCAYYFISVLDNTIEDFSRIKRNIGFLHKNFPDSIVFIFAFTKTLNSEFCDQIRFWEKVSLVSFDEAFIDLSVFHNITMSYKLKLRLMSFIYINSIWHKQSAKIIFFENKLLFDQCTNDIKTIVNTNSILFSEFLMIFDHETYKRYVESILNQFILNLFDENELFNDVRYNFKPFTFSKLSSSTKISCHIKFKDIHLSSIFFDKAYVNQHHYKNPIKKLAILIPIKTDKIPTQNYFLDITLPSLKKSISKNELNSTLLTFYFAYDRNDKEFTDVTKKNHHYSIIKKTFQNSPNIQSKYYSLPISKSVVFLWNFLFVKAFIDRNDYFLQLNDDTKVHNDGWVTEMKQIFESKSAGLIGFNAKEWNCSIFTQAFVSRSHFYKTIGHFYPVEFQNQMSDLWISKAYSTDKICLKNHSTYNHYSKTRYDKCPYDANIVQDQIEIFNKKSALFKDLEKIF